MSETIRASGTTWFIEQLAEIASGYPGVLETDVSANGIRIQYTGDRPHQTVIYDLIDAVEQRMSKAN